MTLKRNRKLVAIVVPMFNRVELTPEEEISKKHLLHHLNNYDKYMLVPKSLEIDIPGFKNVYLNKKFFGSLQAHANLLLSDYFYNLFRNYEFIFIYHLDSLVFSDQLVEWCEQGFDYIGAPWIKHKDAPYAGNKDFEGKVGNGGFSLRRVDSFLKMFNSPQLFKDPEEYWQNYYSSRSKIVQILNYPKKILKNLGFRNTVKWEMVHYGPSEERFIANRADYYSPGFKIADVKTALKFAFECVPQYCFEQNNHNLPFGCHAWHKYDRSFWEPYMLK